MIEPLLRQIVGKGERLSDFLHVVAPVHQKYRLVMNIAVEAALLPDVLRHLVTAPSRPGVRPSRGVYAPGIHPLPFHRV